MGSETLARLAVPLILALAAINLSSCGNRIEVSAAAAATDGAARESLVALARLEPASRVVNLGAPSSGVLEKILVAEGDSVETDQILFLLKSHALRSAELEAARLHLERAELGPLEVEAQQARLRSIEAELEFAREEVGSQKGLSEKGFSAGNEFRNAQLRVRRSQEEVNEARAVLKQLEASIDLEIREAQNGIRQAEARLDDTLIRSPLTGEVLRIRAKVGELVGAGPVASVGATDAMFAVAEVHANEIRMVEVGQEARFTSPALEDTLTGTVEDVGAMIFSNFMTGEDPTAPKGLRVVQVRVRLQANELARRLTNLEGQLRIYIDGGPSGPGEGSAPQNRLGAVPTP